MTEQDLIRDLDSALTRIRNTKPGKTTQGLEKQYGNTYQKLVRLGVKPKLRGKYKP